MRLPLLSFSIAVVFLSFGSRCLSGQQLKQAQAAAAAGANSSAYAGESYVIERLESIYVMSADGTGYRERTVAVKVQSDAAVRQFGVIAIPYASASEKVQLEYARVRRADGTVVETPLTDAQEQPEQVTVQAPFYSDLKQEQLPIKSLRVGDTLEWRAKIIRSKAEAPGQFWGQETFVLQDAVVLNQAIELRVPAATMVNVWTNARDGERPRETTEAGQKIYRWEHVCLKPTIGKEADADKELKKKTLLTPDQVLDAERGQLPSLAWTTFKSWQEVGTWYRTLEADRMVPDDAIKAKVAELTAGKTTEEEKVRAVYGWVSAQIRYIGVAFGVGRYQPHNAAAVLDNQYGDCKDKHTLLAAMLNALGLKPDAVLIGEGVRFNQAVPSPSNFNHLITRVQVQGKEVWLDSTAEVAPYRVLLSVLRDREALVVPETGAAAIVRTPAELPFDSFQTWIAKGSLDAQGVSDSHIAITFRGDGELLLRALLRQVPPAQYDVFVEKLAQGIGYSGKTSHPVIGRPDDTAGPLVIEFDYQREQAGDWLNLRTVAQLAPVSVPILNEKEPPIAPIDLDTPRTETSTAEMKLPDGWGAELPEAVHLKADFATYDMTYRLEKGTLLTQRKLVVLQPKVPAARWKEYKKWQDDVGLGNENYIQLTKPKGSSGAAKENKTVGTRTFNAEALKLEQQAAQALSNMDDKTATALLDQAKALNPEQGGLWAMYGSVAWMRGERHAAIDDFEKELQLHPEATTAYNSLVQLHMMGQDKDSARATLRRWQAADPSDPAPATQLISMLSAEGNTADALTVADAAVAKLPAEAVKTSSFQLQVAKAEMKGGRRDKAQARLLELLRATEDPEFLNDAAYELADADMELGAAETAELAALEKLGSETRSWTLDEGAPLLRVRSYLLIASWDTLGWIYFRQGKLKLAEQYVQAAWRNYQHDEVGGHLVTIRAAIAKPQEASKFERMQFSGKAPSPEPGKSSQELRTVSLGPANGRSGVAEYRMLIAKGKVERAVPMGDKTVDRATELLQAAKLDRYTPEDSDAKIVRFGMINCHASMCDLVLEQ